MRGAAAPRAFSLVELLAALSIILALLSISMPLCLREPDEAEIVREEADRFALWIKSRMLQAALERADFNVVITNRADKNVNVVIYWITGSKRAEEESFVSEAAHMESLGGVELKYSGKWTTLTPAATFMVRSRTKLEERLFVFISGTGYVNIRKTLKNS